MLPVKFSALGTASVWNLDEYAEGVRQFQPKVRASREPWDKFQIPTNPERVRGLANPFRGSMNIGYSDPRVVAALQLWAEISERLRRIHSIQTEALPGFVLVNDVIGGAVGNSGDC